MCDGNHCETLILIEFLYEIKKIDLMFDIQKRGGLIKQHDLRLLSKRPCNHYPLPLAAA
ncbi:MAG TPA: hypothetical protein VMT12_10965 [Syntrophales bacterium]|nr:hypothetical protein [Syntrophales bacterium]